MATEINPTVLSTVSSILGLQKNLDEALTIANDSVKVGNITSDQEQEPMLYYEDYLMLSMSQMELPF